jgi:hypothetical protein
MGEVRRYFDSKYGTGPAHLALNATTTPKVIQTLVGYQWVIGKSALELFYFSAQKSPTSIATSR